MKELMKKPELLSQLSKQARLNAEAYSSKYYAERVLDVYELAHKKKKGFFKTMFHNLTGKEDDDE